MGDAMRQYELKLPILGPGERALGSELARLLAVIQETVRRRRRHLRRAVVGASSSALRALAYSPLAA